MNYKPQSSLPFLVKFAEDLLAIKLPDFEYDEEKGYNVTSDNGRLVPLLRASSTTTSTISQTEATRARYGEHEVTERDTDSD